MAFALTSTAFSNEEPIPPRYACDGSDLSPPLHWVGAPDGIKSFALVVSDSDAPNGTWYHWAIFDLSSKLAALPEGAKGGGLRAAAREAINDFRKMGYGGPCPPHGHGVHHYRFQLMALDVAKLALPRTATCREVEAAAKLHILATADLIGTYAR